MSPAAFCVEAAEEWALARAATLPADPFRLRAMWHVNYVVQAAPKERKTLYRMTIAQSATYGRSGGLTPILHGDGLSLVGRDTRSILTERLWRNIHERVAVTDSVVAHVSRPPDREIPLDGGPDSKYVARTEIFAAEAARILRRAAKSRSRGRLRVVTIGATAGIIGALRRRGLDVSATDLSPAVVGTALAGIRVRNGRAANARLMRHADLAIVTGMALMNRTLPGLMALAKKHNTATMIWAITGKNFGHYYTEHGVDSVISDPSPFLSLPGPATIAIWRRRN